MPLPASGWWLTARRPRKHPTSAGGGFVFDLLAIGGQDLRGRPLRQRKEALLGRVLGAGDAVLKPAHFAERCPEAMVESVQELGLEGVIAKYTGAPYQGGRTSLWQKLILCRPEKGWRVEGQRMWRTGLA